MAPNPTRVDARLRALYDRVPRMVDCKGLCADSCGPIECAVREREKIERAAGKRLEAHHGCLECSMLTPMGRCSVYEDRPMLCRIYGTAPNLQCEHGCRPEFWLTDEEAMGLLAESLLIGGAPPGIEVDVVRKVIEAPELRRQVVEVAKALRLQRSLR